MTMQVNDANFEAEVLQSDIPVLVDFWAPWCGPCRAIAPTLDELSEEYEGKVKIVKMNVDENQVYPMKFMVRSIPFLILVKDGEVIANQVGAAPKSQLEDLIKKAL